ncbi:response regulator [Acidisarcina polymorpha]|uniref:Response regulator n=1 Tax=Acidisarcina polymorpha TaxID=2211140 RepID=A0A2Z5FSJ1_9BACT|nr:response regulator [Acidisarcina polymorpha]AXC09808.1 response regulator [Acidisarcina polymorpha]
MTAKVRAKILVVDDEYTLNTTLVQILEHLGHHVRSARNGACALAEIHSAVPGILISDLNMPDIPGPELLSVIRRRFPSIQVIAMSGGSYFDDALPDGVAADAFYRKGTGLGPLLQMVHAMANSESPKASRRSSASAPLYSPASLEGSVKQW